MQFRPPYLLALDAGTTGNRAILFDSRIRVIRRSYREFTQSFPRPGWVEHDAEEIWQSCLGVLREALGETAPAQVAALGIANQRETVVVWNRATGKPACPAIVWQDRRTAQACLALRERGLEAEVRRKTGLRLDPYFSATKLKWILENVPLGPEDVAGTIDSWLLWNLTAGALHATDASNASRTLLFDLRSGDWDPGLCDIFGVPRAMLPAVVSTGGEIGKTDPSILGAPVPIAAVVGDQQGALFGQGCFEKGAAKCTYGTGLFLVSHAGGQVPESGDLLSTVAWRIGRETEFAVEGSVFIGGAAIQWLRDGLELIAAAAESEALARSLPDNEGVYFVPALAGLGTPYWDASARGLFIGLTRGTSRAHLVRAALESIAYQVRDLLHCLRADLGAAPQTLRVDGGATANDFLMQFQADLLGCPVERSPLPELTAVGAAGIAGLAAGVFSSRGAFAATLPAGRIFEPAGPRDRFESHYARWKDAVARSRGWER
jgi:glycerol kinase